MEFNEHGDLPPGIYQASLSDVLAHFGEQTPTRRILGQRLERIYHLTVQTSHLARFIIFGSFVTDKPNPGNVDVFILMENSFNAGKLDSETRMVFDHVYTQNAMGASIFWIRRLAALGGKTATIAHWQMKRDGTERGIVEVIADD
ncbi:MAG: hypothetical protein GY796_21590 [Chloroflexi bacterium]|nr:hypothetical protein [Chloroflexota bacterium]